MECQICSRHDSEVPGLQCPACARAALFPLRLQHAQALVEREPVSKQVEKVLEAGHPGFGPGKASGGNGGEFARSAKIVGHSSNLAQLVQTKETIDTITRHVEDLKSSMHELRATLHERRQATQQKRERLEQLKKTLAGEKGDRMKSLRADIKERTGSYNAHYRDVVALRIKRCKHAVTLAGLKQIVRPADGNKKTPQYCMWNMLIPDIRQVHNSEAAHVSTMLYHVARMACQLSSYLHVRLPAEITLPHADWPMPTIFSPASSYQGSDATFPKVSPSNSRSGSAKNSRELEHRSAGRPRHLSIDRKLPKLARENPSAYALFVEGVALLAWDVAWLCRVLGLPVAERDWDDVCDMGRNMWLLFANVSSSPSAVRRRTSSRDPIVTIKQADGIKAFSPIIAPAALGVHSHGSANNFLESHSPADHGMCEVSAKGWAFAFPVKIIDELKATLLNDMSGHDWELLDDRDDDVADGTDAEENIVVDQNGQATGDKALNDKLQDRKSTSGWTKLKSRMPE